MKTSRHKTIISSNCAIYLLIINLNVSHCCNCTSNFKSQLFFILYSPIIKDWIVHSSCEARVVGLHLSIRTVLIGTTLRKENTAKDAC